MSNESPHEQEQLALVRRLETRWQLTAGAGGRGPGALLRRALLRVLAPLLAEQREFNAALVQLAYLEGQRATRLNAVMAQALSAHDRINTVAAQLGVATRDLGARLDTLAAFDGEVNDRVARLSHAVGLLNDAVAAADEAAAALAAEIGALKAGREEAQADA